MAAVHTRAEPRVAIVLLSLPSRPVVLYVVGMVRKRTVSVRLAEVDRTVLALAWSVVPRVGVAIQAFGKPELWNAQRHYHP